MGEIIDHQKGAQLGGAGEEGPSPIDLRHSFHEANEFGSVVEHEGIDCDALLRNSLHLLERLQHR